MQHWSYDHLVVSVSGEGFFGGRGSPCCEQVSWDRIFNVKVKADTGGHLSKKLWTSIELRWLCKEDVALIKALLKSVQGLGSQKEGGFFFWDFAFLPKLCFLFWISGFGGGVRTNQNMPWLPGHLLQDLPPGKICLSNVGGAAWWSEVR